MTKLFKATTLSALLLAACGEPIVPPVVETDLKASVVAAGERHTCAVRPDGSAVCWGDNTYGQLGTGSTGGREEAPMRVATDASFVALSSGFMHTCGITTDGRVLCWGHSSAGQLGDGRTWSNATPVVVSGGHTFTQVSAGEGHTCALTADSVAYCWGRNERGELGNGTWTGSAVPVAVATELRFRQLSAGADYGGGNGYTCGVTTDNEGYCWGAAGRYRFGENLFEVHSTPVPVTGGHSFASIAAGSPFVFGVTTDGELLTWGCSSPGDGFSRPCFAPYAVPSAAPVRQLDATTRHACVFGADEETYCIGIGAQGQLGDGTHTSRLTATQPVAGGHRFVQVSAGGGHSCGIDADAVVFCWGEEFSNVPVAVLPPA
jgi:alpha-tubulin suppressor-like RCC1 family protein